MAAITPGTGATIIIPTAEGQVVHSFVILQSYENRNDTNPNSLDCLQGSIDTGASTFLGEFSINCTQKINNSGIVYHEVPEYLINVPFSSGNPTGTFKSTTLAAYFVEALIHLQNLEADTNRNPNRINNVTASFDTDNNKLVGTFTLPVVIGIDPVPKDIAVIPYEYLT